MKKIKKVIIWMVIIMVAIPLAACGTKGKEYDYKLYNSIVDGNLEGVKEALKDGANINKIEGVSSEKSNPTTFAFNSHKDKIAEYLIEHGADTNYTDSSGLSLLMFSAWNTEASFCELLIKHGAKTDKQNKNGYTAIEYVLDHSGRGTSENNIDNMITMLLKHGAKIRPITLKAAMWGNNSDDNDKYKIVKRILGGLIKSGNKSGLNAIVEAAILGNSTKVDELIKDKEMSKDDEQQILFYTAAFGKVETMKLLKNKDVDLKKRDKRNNTSLIVASRYGNLEMVKYLMDNGLNIEAKNYDNDTALIEAASNNYYDEVEALIKKGSKLDEDVLYGAVQNGNIDMMKLIIANGFKLNDDNKESAFETALEYKQFNMAKYLLDNGVDINKEYNDSTTLDDECSLGNLEAVKFLVKNGAIIDDKRFNGEALKIAAKYGEIDIVKYLIEKGADVNAVFVYADGSAGQSALTEAADSGYLDIVKLLVQNGAQVKSPDIDANKNTALIDAAGQDSRNIVEYLIQKGSIINYQNAKGETALISAVSNGQLENVKMLLKYKADTKLKDKDGQTALDIAKNNNATDIINVLENAK
jgi:ankyrin repeat protein